ncbi:uncharacterized protein [Panulirus ornatus]|uniref:uncharacterized protein isoform X2 n=1 Tax=Panulirus ornatus TaxID=150431 RepID=UPI003A86DC16
MLLHILFKLVVMVGMQTLPVSSYNVTGLSVDFDCGDIDETMSNICLNFKSYIGSHSHSGHRGGRSVSSVVAEASTEGNTEPSGRLEVATQHYRHPRAIRVFVNSGNPPITAAREEGVLRTREAASRLVKTRNRREANAKDECCSDTELRQCVLEELHEYCLDTI